MDQLIKIKHRQLAKIRKQIFSTLYAKSVDIYRPYKDAEGNHVLEDEIEFEEADVVGRAPEENMPISYTVLDSTKIVQCKIDEETGKISFVRGTEANEFDVDKHYKYLVESESVPTQSVIQFEVPKTLEDEFQYADWDSGTTYALDTIAKSGAKYYTSQQGTNLNNDPATDDGTWWLEHEINQTITLIKVGSDVLGTLPAVDVVHVFVPFHGDFT
jgi:hypothetical protein